MAASRSAVRTIAREAAQGFRTRSVQQATRGMSAVAAAHDAPIDGFSGAVGNTPLVSSKRSPVLQTRC